MILESAIELHGYARFLIADAHGEYPIPHPKTAGWSVVRVVYDAFDVTGILEHLGQKEPECPFPNLEARYNGHYESTMDLWVVQGSISDLSIIYHAFADVLREGPHCHSDDDVYDYWPNGMDMLYTFALDLLRLTDDPHPWADALFSCQARAIAKCGDIEDWHPIWENITNYAGGIDD